MYKNRSSRKIDFQIVLSREWDFPKTFSLSENQFSAFCHLLAGDLDDAAADAYESEDADQDEPEPEDQVDLVDDDVQRQDAHGVQFCRESSVTSYREIDR